MATANAANPPAETVAKKPQKRLMLIGALVVLLGAGGGGGWYFTRHKAESGESPAPVKKKRTFLPLEPLTVNLQDDLNRFAQVGISLELYDAEVAEQIKQVMPIVRDRILRLISERSAATLLTGAGKSELAAQIMEAIAGEVGHEMPKPKPGKHGKSRKSDADDEGSSTLGSVHFTQFIIQ
jgi:flagellar protein FliL